VRTHVSVGEQEPRTATVAISSSQPYRCQILMLSRVRARSLKNTTPAEVHTRPMKLAYPHGPSLDLCRPPRRGDVGLDLFLTGLGLNRRIEAVEFQNNGNSTGDPRNELFKSDLNIDTPAQRQSIERGRGTERKVGHPRAARCVCDTAADSAYQRRQRGLHTLMPRCCRSVGPLPAIRIRWWQQVLACAYGVHCTSIERTRRDSCLPCICVDAVSVDAVSICQSSCALDRVALTALIAASLGACGLFLWKLCGAGSMRTCPYG